MGSIVFELAWVEQAGLGLGGGRHGSHPNACRVSVPYHLKITLLIADALVVVVVNDIDKDQDDDEDEDDGDERDDDEDDEDDDDDDDDDEDEDENEDGKAKTQQKQKQQHQKPQRAIETKQPGSNNADANDGQTANCFCATACLRLQRPSDTLSR